MTNPASPEAPIPSRPIETTIATSLVLRADLHVRSSSAQSAIEGADYIEAVSNGDRNAALGALLSSMLDLLAIGDTKAAAMALGSTAAMARRICAARLEGITE